MLLEMMRSKRKEEEKSKPQQEIFLVSTKHFSRSMSKREKKLCKGELLRLKMSAKPSHTRPRICLTFMTLLMNASATLLT